VFLFFAVAVVAAAASLARGTVGTIGISLAVLLFLPILGAIDGVRDWLPTTLTTAPVDMLSGASLGHYAVANAMAVASRPTLLTWGVRRLRQRDG
jgi:ABC-2 type transport system permease protein